MKEPLSVCIPARNEEKGIGNTLESVFRQNYDGELDVLVCANGCSENDRTEEIVRQMQRDYPIRLISTSEIGKPNAWNMLRDAARNDLIIYADADVIISAHAFSNIVQRMQEQDDMVTVGGLLTPYHDDSDFITRALYPELTTLGCICGGLYGIRDDAIQDRFTEYGFSEMPKDIIAEDTWLTLLAGEGRWCIERQARVIIRPHTWKEMFKTERRHMRAKKQLEEDYGAIFEENSDDKFFMKESFLGKTKRRLGRIYHAKGLKGKTEVVVNYIMRQYIRHITRKHLATEELDSYAGVWEVSESSKRPIPIDMMYNRN